jgi:hypothetical protein
MDFDVRLKVEKIISMDTGDDYTFSIHDRLRLLYRFINARAEGGKFHPFIRNFLKIVKPYDLDTYLMTVRFQKTISSGWNRGAKTINGIKIRHNKDNGAYGR